MFNPKLFEGLFTKEEIEAIPVMERWADNDSVIYSMESWTHIQKLLVTKYKEHGSKMLDLIKGEGRSTVRHWIWIIAPGVMIDLMKEKYPDSFTGAAAAGRTKEIAALIFKAETHLEEMELLTFKDHFPDIVYDAVERAHFMTDDWMTDTEMMLRVTVTIDGEYLHPRHYRINKKTGIVTFMHHSIIGAGRKVKTTISDFPNAEYRATKEDLEKEIEGVNIVRHAYGIVNASQVLGKVRYESAGTVFDEAARIHEPDPEMGNGFRPKDSKNNVIDNGKRSWPVPKQNKGKRHNVK